MKKWRARIAVLVMTALLIAGIPVSQASASTVTVVAFETQDVSLYECGEGQWMNIGGDEWFLYVYEPICTAILSDGTRVTGTATQIAGQTGLWAVDYTDGQSAQTPWGVGEHTAAIVYGDVRGEFTVTVQETPVASVEAVTTDVKEYHVDGYYDGYTDPQTGEYVRDAWFRYDAPRVMMTVTYKDGTVLTGDREDVYRASGYPPSYRVTQSYGNELKIGDNPATLVFMGVRTDITVTVVDRIDRVEWSTYPDKTDYLYGEHRDLRGGALRVWYTDGTYEDVAVENGEISGSATVERLGKTYSLEQLSEAYLTKDTISFSFLDFPLVCAVTLREPPETLELSVKDDRTLSFAVDGEWFDVRRFTPARHSFGSDTIVGGPLYTDHGELYASFTLKADGTMTMSLGESYRDTDVYAQSNAVNDQDWVLVVDNASAMMHTVYANRGNIDSFDGNITAGTLDDLILLAVELQIDYQAVIGGIMPTEYTCSAEDMNRLLKLSYGKTADVTQSRFYCAEDQKLYVPLKYLSCTVLFDDVSPVFGDGAWHVQAYTSTDESMYYTLDEAFHLTGFDVRDRGDVSGDGALATSDARQMLLGVVGAKALTRAQQAAADMDGNGTVNTSDVRAVLRMSL